ncbi:MAG: radical SAM protein [bacterium]|nr:radical SAM protein [bacterium]
MTARRESTASPPSHQAPDAGLTPDLAAYAGAHRARLVELLQTPAWRETLDSGLVDEVRRDRLEPGLTRDFIDTVVDQLLAFNEAHVRRLIEDGRDDREALITALGTWPPRLRGKEPLLSFLGLTLTYGCNFDPRCVYCTQTWKEPDVDIEGWKQTIDAATRDNGGKGPYIYITGGEVLTLEQDIWGDDGLVAFASRRGAAVNINTNASLITPEIALRLIKVGTAKLHISLDTPDASAQDALWGEAGRYARVLEGIYHLQLARDLVGVDGPEIHINCVLTRHNVDHIADLFTFLLARKKRVPKGHALYYDLLPHLIPVGGDANEDLRSTAAEVERLYGEAWEEVGASWEHYQIELGMPEDKRAPLFGPFRNPYQRVVQHGDLTTYSHNAAKGHYGRLALSKSCYVAPTQAAITPDGRQFRCGAHAVRRTKSIGNVIDGALMTNIRDGIHGLAWLPDPAVCDSCALATVYINQTVESRLIAKVDELLASDEPLDV